jgi:hypothetical protein
MRHRVAYISDTVFPKEISDLVLGFQEYVMSDKDDINAVLVHVSWLKNNLINWFKLHQESGR